MDPTSDKGKNQEDSRGSVDSSPSNATSTAAVATTPQSHAPPGIADGTNQVPPAMLTPPVPDAQEIAALEEEIFGEDAACKKPRGKPEVIEDGGPPSLPAMAAAMNNEDAAMKGTAKKGPELIEDDGDAPADYAASFHDEEGDDDATKKKPAAAKRAMTQTQPQTQPQPQPQLMTVSPYQNRGNNQDPHAQPDTTVPPFHQDQLHMADTNQDGENNQDPPNTDAQDQGPTPQSMLSHSITASDSQVPSSPILEATPVDNQIYDAEVVSAIPDIELGQGQNNNNVGTSQTGTEEEIPWWRRYQRCILFGIVLVLCVVVAVTTMGTLLATQGRSDEGTAGNESKGVIPGNKPSESPTKPLVQKVPVEVESNNYTIVLELNNTAEELLDPAGDEPSTLSPTRSPSDKQILNSIVSSQTKLVSNDGQASDSFGYSVSMSGDTVVIGAVSDADNGGSSGSAYVFIRDGDAWKQQAKLLPNDGRSGDVFGFTVSVSGDTVVVGAHDNDDNGDNSGSAYVFIRDGDNWNQQAKLLPNDGHAGAKFGISVSVSGETVIVGAERDDNENGRSSGSAYVFIRDRDSWKLHAKLLANDGQEYSQFGHAVSVSEDTVVVGDYGHDGNGDNSGSAYVFIRDSDTWKQQAKLSPNDGQVGDEFGLSVSVSGDTVVVAAIANNNKNGSASGAAYVFILDGDTWKQQKLLSNDGQAGDRFGKWVAVSGDTIVIGADKANNGHGCKSGSAYVFEVISPTNLYGQ